MNQVGVLATKKPNPQMDTLSGAVGVVPGVSPVLPLYSNAFRPDATRNSVT
jgi:hypothetical protein